MILYYLFSWILLGSSARLSWFFSVVQVIWLLDWFWVISEFFTHMSGSLNWMVDLGVLSYKWLFSAVFGLLSSTSVDWAALHGIFKIELSERERAEYIFLLRLKLKISIPSLLYFTVLKKSWRQSMFRKWEEIVLFQWEQR